MRFTDTLGVGKYENRRIINGTLIELVDQAAEFVRQYMAISAEIIGFKRSVF